MVRIKGTLFCLGRGGGESRSAGYGGDAGDFLFTTFKGSFILSYILFLLLIYLPNL